MHTIVNLPTLQQKIIVWDSTEITENFQQFLFSNLYDKYLVYIDSNALKNNTNLINNFTKHINNKVEIVFFSSNQSKDYKELENIMSQFMDSMLSRKSCVIVFWWGTMWDLIGFAASIYMRGIDWIFFPTTAMSQFDSTIWKIAINYSNKKNILGTFSSPSCTYCCVDFITSTNFDNVCEWLVEVWKHGILKWDWKLIESVNSCLKNKKITDLKEMIITSLEIKKFYVEKDPFDINSFHKSLSLWHTLANYLESVNSSISHGVAVYIWILFELFLSFELWKISNKIFLNMKEISINFAPFLLTCSSEIIKLLSDTSSILLSFRNDKINSMNSLFFIIPTDNWYEKVGLTDIELISSCLKKTIYFISENSNVK